MVMFQYIVIFDNEKGTEKRLRARAPRAWLCLPGLNYCNPPTNRGGCGFKMATVTFTLQEVLNNKCC